ncbi:hypothetical protein M378DRAFT_18928 [Amanita muscaria Koide BX008]|uniref:Uncharacterized protein n=1 Tax=Amanita muscaria (strain Koide BX008) TaxID=946122 RepID=A0A0C2WCT6_AMAMK|nr:hypothetical protein M378DRAFT_18928 [Amanita muscaria Koide BX008]
MRNQLQFSWVKRHDPAVRVLDVIQQLLTIVNSSGNNLTKRFYGFLSLLLQS